MKLVFYWLNNWISWVLENYGVIVVVDGIVVVVAGQGYEDEIVLEIQSQLHVFHIVHMRHIRRCKDNSNMATKKDLRDKKKDLMNIWKLAHYHHVAYSNQLTAAA